MKILITVTLCAILLSLGVAGVLMLRARPDDDAQRSRQMARALAWRIGLSIALFVAVLLAWRLGWIHPTGLPLAH